MAQQRLIQDSELKDLFKAYFRSLSFSRHRSNILKNLIPVLAGVAVFLVGWFLKMLGLWALGAVVFACFAVLVGVEGVLIISSAERCKKKGKVLKGRVVGSHRDRMKNKWQLEIGAEDGGKKIPCLTEGLFWPVDVQTLSKREVRIIWLGSDRACILLP